MHVEVLVRSEALTRAADLTELGGHVKELLCERCPLFSSGAMECPDELRDMVESIRVSVAGGEEEVSFCEAELLLHVFKLLDTLPEKEFVEGSEDSAGCLHTELPSRSLHGLWEAIVVEPHVKESLLGYCFSSMQFAEAGVDSNVFKSFNKHTYSKNINEVCVDPLVEPHRAATRSSRNWSPSTRILPYTLSTQHYTSIIIAVSTCYNA